MKECGFPRAAGSPLQSSRESVIAKNHDRRSHLRRLVLERRAKATAPPFTFHEETDFSAAPLRLLSTSRAGLFATLNKSLNAPRTLVAFPAEISLPGYFEVLTKISP
jgi:hypothetical protein